MKKKILIALSYVLIAALAITGTIAYLQDTDEDVNVMTLGNVYIEQIEQEWNADQTALVDFTQAKPLYPYVGAMGWENRENDNGAYRRFTMNNVVDKYVSVKNTGKSDAFIRTIFAFEMGEYTTVDEFRYKVIGISNNSVAGKEFPDLAWAWSEPTVTVIDGKNYMLMEAIHQAAVAAKETTIPSLLQVYMNSACGNAEVEKVDGNGNKAYDILVFSQAVQAKGFADAKTALDTAFGDITATNNPWLTDGTTTHTPAVPKLVESAEALKQAIADGEKNLLVTGAEFTEKLKLGSDVNAIFLDCSFSGANAWGYANNVSFTDCTFDSGSNNATIHFDQLYGELVVNNCEFKSGKVQIGNGGNAKATFNNCVFGATTTTGIWDEKGMRFYCATEFNNCEFNNRVVLTGENVTVTFNKCTMNGGQPVYYNDNSDGIIRGGNIPTVIINN